MSTSNGNPDQHAPRTTRTLRRPTWRPRHHLARTTKNVHTPPQKSIGVDVSLIGNRDAARLIAIRGDIDLANAGTLYQRLKALAGPAPQRIVLDMSGVGFIDSAGLHALDDVARQARENGGSVSLEAPSPATALLFAAAEWPDWD